MIRLRVPLAILHMAEGLFVALLSALRLLPLGFFESPQTFTFAQHDEIII